MNADHSRRTFLLGGLATGAVLLAGKTFLHPSAAHAATEAVTLDACVNMTPGEMADRSQYVMAAWKYLQDAAAEIGNPGLRAAVLDIMKNPAPLLAEGDAKAIMAELKGQGLLAQDAKAVFPTCASTKKSPQPFYTAPGSGWNSHHIYPGGLVTHTALNVASCKALYDNYADMFGLKLDRDVVLASQLLHDLHKPWVFQWQADGTCRKEEPLAATGEHHVLSIAESLRRGLSPELCVAQACAHDHPGAAASEQLVVGWLKAAAVIGKGLAASPGAACGQVVFTADEAKEAVESGKMKKVVLVRLETSPEDIVGMQVSQGILTVRGGMTSHAAVVARGMGTCCVSGCGNDNEVKIDEEAKTFEINGHKFAEGDWISIDGSTGNIYGEQVATVAATGNKNFNRFMGWADAARQLLVMTNADNPRDAQQAVDLGAEGIGLCRTEHMFFAEDRIKAVREMICARTVEEREAALAKVEPFQQGDFEAMYRIMGERPMTIRYLDPPLHEFLPTKDEDIKELAADMGMTYDDLKNVVTSLHEFNPMMGHRGCRLAVTYPEIAAMQTRAVIKAALNVSAETGHVITPHIMIPLVGEVKELKFVKDVVVKVADELIAAAGVDMKYQVGTMIEIPRAALTAGEIAKEAEFFSFGTNDLTQMTFGFSRDDAAKFLGAYYENKIYESDPFQHLDQIGVGKLVKMAAHDGRETRPDLGLGICGEHGGDPTSVEFCHNVGLDYVSCSPFRVPIARLAAAQAAIKNPRK